MRVVYGPGTFINSAVEQITAQLQAQTKSRAAQADRAAEAARRLALAQGKSRKQAQQLGDGAARLVYAQFARDLIALNTKYGLNLTGAPRLNDPDFVYQHTGQRIGAPPANFADNLKPLRIVYLIGTSFIIAQAWAIIACPAASIFRQLNREAVP